MTRWFGLGVCWAMVNCGGMAAEHARFVGTIQAPAVSPRQVEDLLIMPEGYTQIGEVSVRCRSSERSDALAVTNTWGDCDTDELIAEMKRRVSKVGGEAMVARRCDTDTDSGVGFDHKPTNSESIRCQAVVVRRTATLTYPVGPQSPAQPPGAVPTAAPSAQLSPAVVDALASCSPSPAGPGPFASAAPTSALGAPDPAPR
jgi:hypothetical protein